MPPKGLALITGAAKRIGREIALRLAEDGWDIGLHYYHAEKEARETAQMIQAHGRNFYLLRANLALPEDVEKLFPTLTALGAAPPTALVNNASLFVKNDNPAAENLESVNTNAPLYLTEILAASLAQSGQKGCVVHMLDGSFLPESFGRYRASKTALENTIPDQARLYAPALRVNGIRPGPSLKGPRQSQDHFNSLITATPLRQASEPAQIAEAVRFLLASPAVTGAVLPLDGGLQLCGKNG